MSQISDALAKQPQAVEPGFTPKTEFDGTSGFIQTAATTEAPASHAEILELFGYNPDEVRIAGNPRISRWQRYDGEWLASYRFHIEAKGDTPDVTDLLAAIDRHKPHTVQGGGAHWFVFHAGDLQIGKRSRDGSTPEIVDRFMQSIDKAVDDLESYRRHGIAGVQICMPGDCLEGNQSQGGKNAWMTAESVPDQFRIVRRLMLATVEAFAPLVDNVYLDVVNGNHDDADRRLNYRPGDGWATEAATVVSDQLAMNEQAFGHVQVRVPDPWRHSMTVPVGDTVCTIAHGHKWRKGHAFRWWADQTFGGQNAGGAHILQHGHFHGWEVETTLGRTRVCSSTYDCGSDYFTDANGLESQRGGLTYLLREGVTSRMGMV